MTYTRPAAVALAVALLAGCATTAGTPSSRLHGDAAHPAQAAGWVETRLYFGLGPAGDAAHGMGEQGWRAFLDAEVTPRFPDGLSVLDVYGQWQGKGQATPERLRSKMLVIDYADTPANRDKVEAIRAAWKQRTGDQSVLRVTQPAEVSF
ncbi:DUF3574 domain-containing protein [Dyella japonica]|uniref:Lipoprotein n=1 Tax=Dyella japonica A8 TaxID=1217721 RepID=A0A075K462_9GAMM|nr:DUF3574 domain-containing protein [Dyella japonica]AIF48880.1 hypothetical protein HY57_17345 [Dyella japonica A8]